MKKHMKKALFLIGCILLFLLALFLIVTHDYSGNAPVSVENTTNPHIAKNKETFISAHRSGGEIAPENTMMAFQNCVENSNFSIDIFEFDLHITKDEELILLHDDTLDRTSNSAEIFGRENVKPSE